MAGDFRDGVCYVGLGAISDARLVAETIAQVLGVRDAGGGSIAGRLEAALRDRRRLLVPSILGNYGVTMADLGDVDRAATFLREGLALGYARGNLWDVGSALEGLARVHAGSGQTSRAATRFGTAAALREETGIPQSPIYRTYFEPFLTALRAELGADAFAAAWAAGRSLAWQAAVTEVLAAAAAEPAPTMSGPARGIRQAMA